MRRELAQLRKNEPWFPAAFAALEAITEGTGCEAPVLLLAGVFDVNSPPQSAAEFAALFPDATLVVQPGAGHCPWLDDADKFLATTAAFLG